MAEERQFEVLLLRLVPYALRDDFMTVGVVVVENGRRASEAGSQLSARSPKEKKVEGGGGDAPLFADVRFTRDWKRVECFAPDFEAEMLELAEATVRERLKDIGGREDLLRLLEERFGSVFDVGPEKALVAEDPVAEMKVLARDYLEAMRPVERPRGRQMGRIAIVGKMQDAFAEAGVLELMQRDLEMKEFTGENDPFRVDFGFRIGNYLSKIKPGFEPSTAKAAVPETRGLQGTPAATLKMFQGLALNLSREPAVMLAYRYGRIQEGMRARGEQARMMAIVNEEAMREGRGEVASGIAMLRASEVEVRGLGEMGEIAEGVRREMRA
jgi:hypothetical protein